MVRSFGDGLGTDEGDLPESPNPLEGFPQLGLALVPVVDQEALRSAVDEIRDAVAQAVLDGFRLAMEHLEIVDGDGDDGDDGDGDGGGDGGGQADSAVGFDGNPTLDGRDRFAMQKYAERLDREVPGWYRRDVDMCSELRRLADARLERERASRSGGR